MLSQLMILCDVFHGKIENKKRGNNDFVNNPSLMVIIVNFS